MAMGVGASGFCEAAALIRRPLPTLRQSLILRNRLARQQDWLVSRRRPIFLSARCARAIGAFGTI